MNDLFNFGVCIFSFFIHFVTNCCLVSSYWHLEKWDCSSLCLCSVPVNKLEPSVCDDTLHPQRLLRLHAARGYTSQCHSLLLRFPQSVWHGESCFFFHGDGEKNFLGQTWHHDNLVVLLHVHRPKQEWWWTSSESVASLWPWTVGVVLCFLWTRSLRGPTPQQLCRTTSVSATYYKPVLSECWGVTAGLWMLGFSFQQKLSFSYIDTAANYNWFWATRVIILMFGPSQLWCESVVKFWTIKMQKYKLCTGAGKQSSVQKDMKCVQRCRAWWKKS